MEEKFYVISEVKRIENVILNLFGKEGIEDLIKAEWENVKDEYKNRTSTIDIAIRLLIEDLIIYLIASEGKEGYNKVLEIKEKTNIIITIKSYEEIEKHYDKYINKLREYFKNNNKRDQN